MSSTLSWPRDGLFSKAIRPRVHVVSARGATLGVLLAAALASGVGMTLAVDRLESAARTRASLERQTAALQERLIPADPAAPALQQVREDYDRAIAQAADLARGSIWASLCLMLGTVAWMERRRRVAAAAQVVPAVSEQEAPPAVEYRPTQAEPAAASVTIARDDRGERSQRLGDIAREMRALRDWIGADPQGDAPAPQHRHQQAAVRSVRFHLAA
jgi:hypothetical protein